MQFSYCEKRCLMMKGGHEMFYKAYLIAQKGDFNLF